MIKSLLLKLLISISEFFSLYIIRNKKTSIADEKKSFDNVLIISYIFKGKLSFFMLYFCVPPILLCSIN